MSKFIYLFELQQDLAIYSHQTTLCEDCDKAKSYLESIGKFNPKLDQIIVNTGTCALTFLLNAELSWADKKGLSKTLNEEEIKAISDGTVNSISQVNMYHLIENGFRMWGLSS